MAIILSRNFFQSIFQKEFYFHVFPNAYFIAQKIKFMKQKNVKNAAKYKQNYSTKDKNLPFKIIILLGILSSSYQIKQEKKSMIMVITE